MNNGYFSASDNSSKISPDIMTRTRIKFCGITRQEDALAAARLGVDAIGLVFTSRSPRCLDLARARAIVHGLPPLVLVVALFLNDDAALIQAVEKEVRPSLLQFHGTEDEAFCTRFDTPYVKVIGMGSVADATLQMTTYPGACGFVLDGHAAGAEGGQGKTFDWSRVPEATRCPLILAGGLDADNVADAVRRVRPWAVDVSSGIETAPGIKSIEKMQAFVQAVQSVS